MNTDRALVLQFLQGDRTPTAINSNPLARDLGGVILDLDAAQGIALLAFEPLSRFLQGARVIQGGIIATMLDFAVAYAAHARLPADKSFATATLTVNLRKAALPGRHLLRGRIDRVGARLIFASADMSADGAPDIIASASAVMAVLPA